MKHELTFMALDEQHLKVKFIHNILITCSWHSHYSTIFCLASVDITKETFLFLLLIVSAYIFY